MLQAQETEGIWPVMCTLGAKEENTQALQVKESVVWHQQLKEVKLLISKILGKHLALGKLNEFQGERII